METRRLRDTTAVLPGEDPDDVDQVEAAPRPGAAVADALVTGDDWTRVELTQVTLSRSWLLNADLSGTRWDGGAIDRCVFRACTLVGANIANTTLKNVIFENCRLDYAALSHVRTVGPTLFLGCSLTETTFQHSSLTDAAFDGCKLAATSFDECDLRGADLRGNDLAAITGVASLRGARLTEIQLAGLTEAVVRDFQLNLSA
jgi:uncharacterized protein YjbI with pentapeptide repeats